MKTKSRLQAESEQKRPCECWVVHGSQFRCSLLQLKHSITAAIRRGTGHLVQCQGQFASFPTIEQRNSLQLWKIKDLDIIRQIEALTQMAASIRAAVTGGSLGLGRVVTFSKWSHHQCLTVICSPPKKCVRINVLCAWWLGWKTLLISLVARSVVHLPSHRPLVSQHLSEPKGDVNN